MGHAENDDDSISDTTTIQVSNNTWGMLASMKEHPSETYEEVIFGLIISSIGGNYEHAKEIRARNDVSEVAELTIDQIVTSSEKGLTNVSEIKDMAERYDNEDKMSGVNNPW
jgi:hypothetical protein